MKVKKSDNLYLLMLLIPASWGAFFGFVWGLTAIFNMIWG